MRETEGELLHITREKQTILHTMLTTTSITIRLASIVTMFVLVFAAPAPAFVAWADEAPPAESSAPSESAPSSDSSSDSGSSTESSGSTSDTGGDASATGGDAGAGGNGGTGANGGDAGTGGDGGTGTATGDEGSADATGGDGGAGGTGGDATTGDAGSGGTGGDGGGAGADSENDASDATAGGGDGGSGGAGGDGLGGGADAGEGGNGGNGGVAETGSTGEESAGSDATGGDGGSGGAGGDGGSADTGGAGSSGGASGDGSGGGSGSGTGDVAGASTTAQQIEDELGDTATSSEAQTDLTGETEVTEVGDALIMTGRSSAFGYLISLFNIAITNSTGNILFLRNPLGDALDFTQRIIDLFSGLVSTACNLVSCESNDDAKFKIYTENEVEIKNELVVSSLSGDNRAHSTEGDASIDTGDALAYGGIVNFGNLQLVDSRYLILLMQNEGDLSGDILLPDGAFFKTLSTGATLGRDSVLNVNNDAGILNNGTTTALTGDNTALSTEGSDITTGDGRAKTTVANFVNQIGAPICFVVSVGGTWNGNVVQMPEGFQHVGTEFGHLICGAGGAQDRGGHDGLVASTTNYARILNDAIVEAKTGANIAEGQSATIDTGNADAFLTILNVVNQTIIGQDWIFAMFNIAGDWDGDLQFGPKPGEPDILGEITEQVIGGGGGGGGGGSGGSTSRGNYYTPNVVFTKEANVVQVSSPAQVEYVITVDNKGQGLRKVVVNDTLVAPDGREIGTQKWDLGVLRANEVVTIKYTVDFGAQIKPGYYKNTAKMSGLRENGVPLSTLTAQDVVEILPTGEVLAEETCAPLLTEYIRPAKRNTPAQVIALQTFLNSYEGETLETTGIYDSRTVAAVMRFQTKYATDILAPWGISRPTGNVYYTTQKKVNEIACQNQMTFELSEEQVTEISRFRTSVKAPGTGLDELLKKNETGQVKPKQNASTPKPIQSVSLLAPKPSETQFGLPMKLFSGLFLNLVPFVEAFEL